MRSEIYTNDYELIFMRNHFIIQKTKLTRVIGLTAFIIILALFLQTAILTTLNKKSGLRTVDLLLNEVLDIIEKNEQSKTELINSLKEEYIIRSQVVSFILDSNPENIEDVQELQNIAASFNIDEIYIFDENGVIVSGTHPENFGISFYSGEQISFFLPMLNDRNLKMCQDITPNSASGKEMTYAISWNNRKDKMIQIGVEPKRIVNFVNRSNIAEVVAEMPAYEGVSVFVADSATGIICASTEETLMNLSLQKLGISMENVSQFDEAVSMVLNLDGYRNFLKLKQIDKYIVAVTYSTQPHIGSFFISLTLVFVFLLIAGFSIIFMIYREEKLIHKSNTDELTGVYNRRAYKKFISDCNNKAPSEDFIYVSLDANGLKVLNDTLGHDAGDEMIIGTAKCMKQCFGPYGRLYRMGGDEFVAMIFATKKQFAEIKKNFDAAIMNWKGELVDHITVSYGWVSKSDSNTNIISDMANAAEKKMYEEKSAFYRKSGVDRRGQKDAHTALCALYTKILKINITDDTYQIVNMDANEKTETKGFSDKISEWLRNFGTSGQVHADDLDEYLKKVDLAYLREYFAGNKSSINIFYRRKIGSEYKQVLMEMIPANDYSHDNQSLFLYVKNIDK